MEKHCNLYYLLEEDRQNNPLREWAKRRIKRKMVQRYRQLQIDRQTKTR